MSNHDKTKVDINEDQINKDSDDKEKEKVKNKEEDEEEEAEMNELVLGIPALRISESYFSGRIRKEAVIAAELVVAAAGEAVLTKGKKVTRTRKTKANVGSSGSSAMAVSQGEAKKLKKKGSELTNPPEGPPMCNICGRGFGSWKAVFGHLRSHKERNYQGFLPPPKFSAAAEGFAVATSSGQGNRKLGLDLNVEPVDQEETMATESNVKFDLNKTPPKEEEEEEDKGV